MIFDKAQTIESDSRIFSNYKGFFCRASNNVVKGPYTTLSEAENILNNSSRSITSHRNHFSWSDFKVI